MNKEEKELLVCFINGWIPNNSLTKDGKECRDKIVALIEKPEVTEEWIGGKVRESINKSFKDYETEIQAILFVDPIHKSSYRKINKVTDALVDHIWDSIRSLVKEIQMGRKK